MPACGPGACSEPRALEPGAVAEAVGIGLRRLRRGDSIGSGGEVVRPDAPGGLAFPAHAARRPRHLLPVAPDPEHHQQRDGRALRSSRSFITVPSSTSRSVPLRQSGPQAVAKCCQSTRPARRISGQRGATKFTGAERKSAGCRGGDVRGGSSGLQRGDAPRDHAAHAAAAGRGCAGFSPAQDRSHANPNSPLQRKPPGRRRTSALFTGDGRASGTRPRTIGTASEGGRPPAAGADSRQTVVRVEHPGLAQHPRLRRIDRRRSEPGQAAPEEGVFRGVRLPARPARSRRNRGGAGRWPARRGAGSGRAAAGRPHATSPEGAARRMRRSGAVLERCRGGA
jgi:hypothetical protein